MALAGLAASRYLVDCSIASGGLVVFIIRDCGIQIVDELSKANRAQRPHLL
jgi:hypothetical protein